MLSGSVLMHEHVFHTLGLAGNDPDQVLLDEDLLVAELKTAREAGVGLIVDQTTVDMGRQPASLARAATASGVQLVASTGFYRELTYATANVSDRSESNLAEEMVRDIEVGFDADGVRAGAIGEIGTSDAGISDAENKVLRACAQAQRLTDCAILTHTPFGKNAGDQLDILERAGADPGRVVIGHVCGEADLSRMFEIARRGASLSYDRIGAWYLGDDEDRLDRVLRMIAAGFESQIVLSMDIARRSRLRAFGGHGFLGIHEFLPRLREHGVPEATITQIVERNPRRILAF